MTATEYAAKMQARADRTRRRAESLRQRSGELFRSAMAILDPIPSGQPILVDHYSANRHRRALERHDKRMRAAIEAEKRAKWLESRTPSTAISADDPEASAKLTAKAEAIDATVERMKAVNAAWRKAGKPAPDDAEGWGKVAAVLGCELAALERCRLEFARHPWQGQPFPAFRITNARARQRAAEARAKVTANRPTTGQRFDAGDGITVESCPDDNRIRVTFPGKPDAATIATLKGNGFKWAPSVGAWQRQWTNGAVYAVRQMFPAMALLADTDTAPRGA